MDKNTNLKHRARRAQSMLGSMADPALLNNLENKIIGLIKYIVYLTTLKCYVYIYIYIMKLHHNIIERGMNEI